MTEKSGPGHTEWGDAVPPYGPPGPMPPHESPLDILARRFAAGEISADEYQKARDLLKGDSKS